MRTNSNATPPTAEFHLAFLAKIERLLSQGRFTSTYKFALLIALTNIAVERGDDSGDELEVEVDEIARQFLELYWSMARPYPRVNTILKQNREAAKPSRMITILKDEVRHSISSYQRLRVYRASRDGLLSETRRTLAKDVLYRLHTIGKSRDAAKTSEQFLYDHPRTAGECAKLDSITLKAGVAAAMRRLRGVIVAMTEARWVLWVRENNEKLAADRELEEFLFGATRSPVSNFAARFYDLQEGRCFYTGDKLREPSAGDVDHFIPWARYPFDSPFNLVLASKKVNNTLRDTLKPLEWRDRWLARNDSEFSQLTAPVPHGFGALPEDRATSEAIAAWVYQRNEP